MSVQTFITASPTSPPEKQALLLQRSQSASQPPLNELVVALEGKVDNLIDGVLILTEQQELIYANDNARRVLRQLDSSQVYENFVPQEISHVCQSLIHSRSLFPHQHWVMASEIFANDFTALHIRARWLQVEPFDRPCLLLTIEDQYQALKSLALEEAQQYGLTAREKEVWLLHRANYSHKHIAQELCITPNTVKKHMQSIHVKKNVNSTHPMTAFSSRPGFKSEASHTKPVETG